MFQLTQKKSFLFYTFFMIFFIIFHLSGQNASQKSIDEEVQTDSLEVDSLFYEADSVFFDVKENRLELINKAKIIYHTSMMEADTISIDIDKNQAITKGHSILTDKDQIVLGDQLFFDLDSQQGMISKGASRFDQGYYYGEEIRKIDDKVFDVDDGKFTTCDAKAPHFYIYSKKLRLYHNDKVVAKPILFFVNHFPVLGLPYGTFTVKKGRHSGILVPSPGYDKINGKKLEDIALFYAYHDYADVFLMMDYYEKTGWRANFLTDYKKRYDFDGKFSTELKKTITSPQAYRYDWRIKCEHNHTFRNNKTLDLDIDFFSSSSIWEGSDDVNERLSEKITSNISYKQQLWGRSFYLDASYTDDFKNEMKSITLPNIRYSLPLKPVYELFSADGEKNDSWWKNFNYSYYLRAAHEGDIKDPDADFWDVIYKTKKDSTGNYITQHNAGIKHTISLSYNYKFSGWLQLTQSLSYNEAWFDRDINNVKLVRGYDYSTTSKMSFSMYGIRTFNHQFLKAIRHIFTPTVSFNYLPDFTHNDRFYNFDGISVRSGTRSRRINFSLSNKWQLKYRTPKGKQDKKINDFITISSSTSYDMEKEEDHFSNISHRININPGNFSYKIFALSTDPSLNITQKTNDIQITDFDYKKWDWAIDNWVLRINNRISFSGNASYKDYFPLEKNQFVTQKYFDDDTTEKDELDFNIEDYEEMEQNKTNWSFTFNHAYSTDKQKNKNNQYDHSVRSSINFDLTKNWKCTYSNTIDIKEKELKEFDITVKRKLHCWEIYFHYEKSPNFWKYEIKLFNVEFPKTLLLKTSDRK